MKLSTKVRYGLRAMVDLARTYGGDPVSMATIAKQHGISRKYLHAILTTLRTAGFVKAARGTTGGYVLARPPASFRVSDIVEVLEGSITLADCVNDSRTCGRAASCVTREVWQELSRAIEVVLSGITLEDLVRRSLESEGDQSAMYYI